ncbi:MAG: phenylacetate--CoA ligase [Kiritimatiellae bacterium]|nr:phenylacetate--CoA ligase [Kiritimatiellia bacterium]
MNRLKFWNERAETMSRDELSKVQLEGLQKTVKHVWANNEFYRKRLTDAGIEPGDIKSLDDLRKLPFLTKDDFRDQYPLGMFCMPRNTIREMHMSSGSTGTPVVMAYTEADLTQWAECMARCQIMAGLQPGDTLQVTPTFGLFNGGFGFYHGARRAGLFTVPASSGNTARQIKLMRDFHVKGLGSVVSYLPRIIEVLEKEGQTLPDLKIGIFGAETFSDAMRQHLREVLDIDAFDIYGMTETGGVGTTGMDCPAHDGIHVWEDQYITEIVNPDTGEPVPDGEMGEVIITSLTREGIPVIRYRTRDLSRIVSREKCACGRTSLRIDRIPGRCDDMLIVKGVNFFPRQIEQALLQIPGVLPDYQIVLETKNGITDVRINVEAEEGVTGYTVAKHLKEVLGFSPKGDVFKPGSLPRTEGKAKRVIKINHDEPN